MEGIIRAVQSIMTLNNVEITPVAIIKTAAQCVPLLPNAEVFAHEFLKLVQTRINAPPPPVAAATAAAQVSVLSRVNSALDLFSAWSKRIRSAFRKFEPVRCLRCILHSSAFAGQVLEEQLQALQGHHESGRDQPHGRHP